MDSKDTGMLLMLLFTLFVGGGMITRVIITSPPETTLAEDHLSFWYGFEGADCKIVPPNEHACNIGGEIRTISPKIQRGEPLNEIDILLLQEHEKVSGSTNMHTAILWYYYGLERYQQGGAASMAYNPDDE